VHGESGQATVEWVALALIAALVLGAAAALAGREADRGLGEAIAERITRTAAAAPDATLRGEAAPPPAAAAPRPRGVSAPPPRPMRAAPRPPAARARAVDAFRGVRGVADVAKHAWIVCLGYERWRHELEHPAAPNEALPVDVALDIVNTCFNPHDYLLQEE
jgi:hypothetical protein